MFDAIKLLGEIAQSSSLPTAGGRVGTAVQASPLDSIFSRLSGRRVEHPLAVRRDSAKSSARWLTWSGVPLPHLHRKFATTTRQPSEDSEQSPEPCSAALPEQSEAA